MKNNLSVTNHLSILNPTHQDCLAEGRSVSLPASAVGASKLAVTAVGAYARIRKQFRVPIAEMGGVQVNPSKQYYSSSKRTLYPTLNRS